jgi:hypothetical protein
MNFARGSRNTAQEATSAHHVIDPETDTLTVAEIELGPDTDEGAFAAMLIDPDHAALEDARGGRARAAGADASGRSDAGGSCRGVDSVKLALKARPSFSGSLHDRWPLALTLAPTIWRGGVAGGAQRAAVARCYATRQTHISPRYHTERNGPSPSSASVSRMTSSTTSSGVTR